MNTLDEFAAAGYAPFPAIGGRPIVGGISNGTYRFMPGHGERFQDCDVGLVCAARPLSGASGAGSLAAVSSTWIAAVSWTTHNPAVRKEIDALVSAALGEGPAYIEGDTVTRLARVERQLFSTRRLPAMHFSGENWKSLTYKPHRFDLSCRGSWLILNRNAKPTPRAELPAIDGDGAERLISSVETAFNNRGALPWR